eukprot:8376021-Alexandrium_andersonii.AAC.1
MSPRGSTWLSKRSRRRSYRQIRGTTSRSTGAAPPWRAWAGACRTLRMKKAGLWHAIMPIKWRVMADQRMKYKVGEGPITRSASRRALA